MRVWCMFRELLPGLEKAGPAARAAKVAPDAGFSLEAS